MYNEFAYFYDELNGAANYRRLHRFIRGRLRRAGLKKGIVADLGCGTGKLTAALAKDGYDMLAVDLSQDMLEMLQDRLSACPKAAARVQLLRQDLTQLDFFGTVQGAVSTFDTLNHIGPYTRFAAAVARIALFMDKDALFIFDMNTPYKHRCVLADNTFEIDAPDAHCVWQNHYCEAEEKVELSLTLTPKDAESAGFHEAFTEYGYGENQVREACEACGLAVREVLDGETFRALTPTSQRMIFVTQKQYTQRQKENPYG